MSATSAGEPSSAVLPLHRLDAVRRQQRPVGVRGGRPVVAERDREADRLLDPGHVPADVGAVLGQEVELRADLLDRAAGVPAVGPQRHGPERLARPGPADQDRQVALKRPRGEESVVERVEAALVAEPLAVEQPAHEHDRLVQPVEPLAVPGEEVDAVGVVLALEPRATDAEDGPPARQVVERRGQLGRVARVAERVRADHEPEPDARRDRGEARQDAPALEDRLLPRPEDGHQVIPCPDGVPARLLGGEGRIAEARPVGLLRPELEPEARHSSAR